MNEQKLREKLRAIRQTRGLTQAALGAQSGLSQSVISLLESGRPAQPATLARWAESLGYTLTAETRYRLTKDENQ